MSNLSIFFTAIALAMDAFAVAICKGLSIKKLKVKHMVKVGIWFGLFQMLMPLIGYLLSYKFENIINSVDHYVAFFLLSIIGINMIKESFCKETLDINDSFKFKTMFILSVATSIDALAVGITFAFLNVNIYYSTITIGIVTFIISLLGIKIGNLFGIKYKNKAELLGGIILIIIGIKILLEHLG